MSIASDLMKPSLTLAATLYEEAITILPSNTETTATLGAEFIRNSTDANGESVFPVRFMTFLLIKSKGTLALNQHFRARGKRWKVASVMDDELVCSGTADQVKGGT